MPNIDLRALTARLAGGMLKQAQPHYTDPNQPPMTPAQPAPRANPQEILQRDVQAAPVGEIGINTGETPPPAQEPVPTPAPMPSPEALSQLGKVQISPGEWVSPDEAASQRAEQMSASTAASAAASPELVARGVIPAAEPEPPPEFHPGGQNWEKLSPGERAEAWQTTLRALDPQHAQVMLDTIGRTGELGPQQYAAMNYLMARPGGQAGWSAEGSGVGKAFGGMEESYMVAQALGKAVEANPALLSDPKFQQFVESVQTRNPHLDMDLTTKIREQRANEAAIAASMKELGLSPGEGGEGATQVVDQAETPAVAAPTPAPAPETAPEPAAPRETPRERRQREREEQQDQETEARQRFADQGGMLPMPESWRGTPDQWAAQWESLAPKGRVALTRAAEKAEGRGAVAAAPSGPVGIDGRPLNTAWTPQGYYTMPAGRTGHASLLEPLIARIAGPRGEFEKQAHEMAYCAFHQMLSDLQDWSAQANEMDLLAKHAMESVEGDTRVKTAAANVFQADHIGRLMAEGQMLRMVGLMKTAGISVQPGQISVDFGESRIPARRSGAYDASAGAQETTPQDVAKSPGRQPGAE